MKNFILLLALSAAVVYSQTDPPTSEPGNPNAVCAGLRLQNLDDSCTQQLGDLLSLDVTMFCSSQCAADVRQIYMECGFSDTDNPVAVFCSGAIIGPDVACLAEEVPMLSSCLTILSGDPTAFCDSDCASDASAAYTRCGFVNEGNPINILCGTGFALPINITNSLCLGGRLSGLQNCVLELTASPSSFCTTPCANTLSSAFTECGYTGELNLVSQLCASGIPVQDPQCVSNRLQNIQGCLATFLGNVSAFCNSQCSEYLTTIYDDCGYTGINNPILGACSQLPVSGGDPLCVSSRLQSIGSCFEQITENATAFCESDCRTQVQDAYIDCGYVSGDNLTSAICAAFPSNGPDPICLAERQAGIQSCVDIFLTNPSEYCTSQCFTDLNDAYNDCGYVGPGLNPFYYGCALPSAEDPVCLYREIVNLDDCFSLILTNQSAFCSSDCRTSVSNAFEGCGYSNESNPANLCLAGDPSTAVEQCLATELQQVPGCLTEFTQNPFGFCTGQCASEVRAIYTDCGYESQYAPYFNLTNPVDEYCAGSGVSQQSFCPIYGLVDQTECLSLSLLNVTEFCTSGCVEQINDVYTNCGLPPSANTLAFVCSNPAPSQDATCLSSRLQNELPCTFQLLTNPVEFCSSECADRLSAIYEDCGFTGYANGAFLTCNVTTSDPGADACLGASTVYQDCIVELSSDPSGFCTSQCVSNINNLFTQCGLPASANPAAAYCAGLLPDIPGQPNPTCLAAGLTNLQDCIGTITADPTNFCGTQCSIDLSTAYDECGFVNDSNPVTLLCESTPTGTGDLVCLSSSLASAQGCIAQLATDPSTFCNSQCYVELNEIYTGCGFIQSANPVNLACGGGVPGQDPFCIAGKLESLQDCTAKLNDQDFCGSECESELRTAYSECGFTGTTNPVAILCSGTDGQPNTVCLGTQLQLNQECVSELFLSPEKACTDDSECTTTLQNAYTTCGYVGSDNPIGTRCSQIGSGAAAGHTLPILALSLLLIVALAAIFY